MEMLQQAAAVAVVLALLGGTLWWLRSRGIAGVLVTRRSGGRRLESVERLPLGPQHTLHLVRLGRTALLLACSPGGCALITSLPLDEVAGGQEALR